MQRPQLRSTVLQARPKNPDTNGAASNTSPNEPVSNTPSQRPYQSNEINQTIHRKKHTVQSGDSSHVKEEKNRPGSSAQVCEHVGDPVNMATGELIYEDNDFVLPDINGDFLLTRRYTSGKDKKYRKSLGNIWTFSTDTAITRDGDITTVTLPDSKTVEFRYEEQQYKNTRGGNQAYTLIKPETEFIFIDHQNHIKYIYSEAGTILKTIDHNGNTTDYTYSCFGIDTISLATGLTLTFEWKDMKIHTVRDNLGRTVQYTYENSLLTKVTRCDGTEITYQYDESENLIRITDALGCTYLRNKYDEHRRVTEQHLADGSCFSYTYHDKQKTNYFTNETEGTTLQYEYDNRFDITKI